MKTGTKVALGAGIAALIGGAVYVARRRKPLLGLAAGGPDADRIGDVQDVVWKAMRDGQMRELAIALTSRGTRQVTIGRHTVRVKGYNCEPRDGRCEANSVAQWVHDNPAIALASMGVGGDSSTALTCALVSLNGVTCRLRAARLKDGTTRIYPTAGLPKNNPSAWVAVDSGQASYAMGRELPQDGFEDFDG